MKTLTAGLAVLIILGGILSGCGTDFRSEDAQWFQNTESGKALPGKEITDRINQENNLFSLYEMKRAYIMSGGKSQAIVKALDKRRDGLVEAKETEEAIPGKVDFIDWDISRLDDGRYMASAYFIVKEKPDRDWRMKFIANVDDQHIKMLPPDSRASKRLRWKINPDTSTWEKGEHKILSHIFEFKPIPYDISGVFFLYPDNVYGNRFEYGWFADPGITGPDE